MDVGRFNRNLQIPARFGITKRLEGVPALLIATPDGKLVNGKDVFATASASEMTPQSWRTIWRNMPADLESGQFSAT